MTVDHFFHTQNIESQFVVCFPNLKCAPFCGHEEKI